MHILVATDGHLDAEKATGLISRLYEPDDTVTLLTAVDHPRQPPADGASLTGVDEVAMIAHEAGAGVIGMASGAKAAERLVAVSKHKTGGQATTRTTPPQAVNEYFTTTAQRRLNDLLQRLEDRGIEATAAWSPTENQTARTILEYAERENVDLLIIGSHGRGRFEGPLGSTVTKLMRRAAIPVLVVR